jgi:hypothetical protein
MQIVLLKMLKLRIRMQVITKGCGVKIGNNTILHFARFQVLNGGEYEDDSFLGYSAVYSGESRPKFSEVRAASIISAGSTHETLKRWSTSREYMTLYPVKLSSSRLQ